jgi:hypothetical protein
MSNVILFPIVKRPEPYELHMALLKRRKKRSEEPKDLEQEMTDTWRSDKFADARLFIDRLLTHPLGGKDWVLKCLDDIKEYVERQ